MKYLLLLILSLFTFCIGSTNPSSGILAEVREEDKVKIQDIKIGTGAVAKNGDVVVVHYTGTLTNGKKFDSSLDRKQPFKFELGRGQVIRGWEVGVEGMKIGGKRKLIIPPHFAYGERGSPPVIPPNATLIFEIELLGLE